MFILSPEKCIHIDNGFMRKGESELVIKTLTEIGIECEMINGRHQFYNAQVDFFLGYPNFRDTLWLEFRIYRATVFCNQ